MMRRQSSRKQFGKNTKSFPEAAGARQPPKRLVDVTVRNLGLKGRRVSCAVWVAEMIYALSAPRPESPTSVLALMPRRCSPVVPIRAPDLSF